MLLNSWSLRRGTALRSRISAYEPCKRKRHGRAKPSLEALEDRVVPTAYVFVDFGDNFPGANHVLTTTVGAVRDVATAQLDSSGNPIPFTVVHGPQLTKASNVKYTDNTTVSFTNFNFTADQRAKIMQMASRAFASLNVRLVELTATAQALPDGRSVVGASNLGNVAATLRGNNTGSSDAYIIAATPAIGASNDNPNAFATNGYGGIAPTGIVLAEQTDLSSAFNNHDDLALAFVDPTTPINFVANTIVHETGHTFGLQHAVTNAAPAGTAVNNLIHQAEVMSYLSSGAGATPKFFFTRFPMVRGDTNTPSTGSTPFNNKDLEARRGQVTPFDQLRVDLFVGENPAFHFISGTAAHDIITITDDGNGLTASVTVQAFSDNAHTQAITVPGRTPGNPGSTTHFYTISLDKGFRIEAGPGDDIINLNTSARSLIVNAGSGDDTINIEKLPRGMSSAIFNGEGGVDQFRFSPTLGILDDIQSSATINGVFEFGTEDQLWLNDSRVTNNNRNYYVTDKEIRLPGRNASIFYHKVGQIDLLAGSGANTTADVAATPAGSTMSIFGAAVVNVGKPPADPFLIGKTTRDVRGKLNLFNLRPMVLNIDDTADSLPRTVTIGKSQVAGLTDQPIDFTLARLSKLTVSGGTGGNTFIVQDTATSDMTAGVTLNTGNGADTVYVQQVKTSLLVDGVRGRDTVNVGLSGKLDGIAAQVQIMNSGNWSLINVDDSADSLRRTLTFGISGKYGTISGFEPPPGQIIYRKQDLAALDFRGGSGNNTYNVQNTPQSTIAGGSPTTLHAGSGQNAVNVYATTGRLLIDSQSADNRITIGGAQGQAGSLNGLLGDVSVSGVVNFLSIIDGANTVPYTYTMDAQRFYRTDSLNVSTASIYYNQALLNRLDATMGNGGNYFLVNGSPNLSGAPNSGTSFYTGLGDDSVRIRGSNSPLDVNLGFGANQTIFLGDGATPLDGIKGVVNVFGANMNVFVSNEASTHGQVARIDVAPGGSGQTFIRQQLNGDHYDTLNTFNFGFLGQESFSYHAGQGGDVTFLIGTPANTTTSLIGGTGFDGFWVETDQPACLGPVSVYADPTVGEYSYYYDYLNPAAQSYTVTSVANPGGPDIEVVQRGGAAPVTFVGLQQIVFYTPHVGGNSVDVLALPQRMFLNMVNGPEDVVTLGREEVPGQGRTMQAIEGAVAVQGAGHITVTLDDSGDPVGRNVALHPNVYPDRYPYIDSITGLNSQFLIQLDDSAFVSILGGQGDDTFKIKGTTFLPSIRIDGGGGTNTLDYSAVSDPVYVDLQAGTATGLKGGIANIQNVIGAIINYATNKAALDVIMAEWAQGFGQENWRN